MPQKSYTTHRFEEGHHTIREETLAHEGPLHITLNGESYLTTMRTADGNDTSLARGLLFTEGIVVDQDASLTVDEISDPETATVARLSVTVDPGLVKVSVEGRRSQLATSSCGICGTRDPADLELFGDPLKVSAEISVKPHSILGMLESMNKVQSTFHETGGTHAAGAYKTNGAEIVVREDIGRHNAVDKVIGHLLENKQLADIAVLTVSGRVSYEIVSKIYRAQIPILVAVSAPSSMAVETADAFGITLIGFCRDTRFTIYTHPQRITMQESSDE